MDKYNIDFNVVRTLEHLNNVPDEELIEVCSEWLDSVCGAIDSAEVMYGPLWLGYLDVKGFITFALFKDNECEEFKCGITSDGVLELLFEHELEVVVVKDLFDELMDQ